MYISRKFWFDQLFFKNHDKLNIKKIRNVCCVCRDARRSARPHQPCGNQGGARQAHLQAIAGYSSATPAVVLLFLIDLQRHSRADSTRIVLGCFFHHARVSVDMNFFIKKSYLLPNHALAICSLFGWLVADGWCWFVLKEEYCWLVAAGCWWLVRSERKVLLAGG
jgi:hypothetical protein